MRTRREPPLPYMAGAKPHARGVARLERADERVGSAAFPTYLAVRGGHEADADVGALAVEDVEVDDGGLAGRSRYQAAEIVGEQARVHP